MTSTPELLIRILFFVSLLAVIAGCEVPESAQTEGATIEQRDLPEQQTDSTPEMSAAHSRKRNHRAVNTEVWVSARERKISIRVARQC